MTEPLKAPFPYFGGKRAVAEAVWARLGRCQNYVEPFAGSLAVLLLRPRPFDGVETVNDWDCYLANFWRATHADPDAVASFADGPVNECDLHSRHRWLVLSDHAREFRQKMRTDPDHFDAKVAGWWCWGLCCWIGSGWCSVGAESCQIPLLSTSPGAGVHSGSRGLPQQIPVLRGRSPGGMDAAGGLARKVPRLTNDVALRAGPRGGNRPQLADAYDVGRGVHANGGLGACGDRQAWLADWFRRLRDRLRLVRVCCGDWSRVCSSESTTTRLGLTGVFLDPPYPTVQKGKKASRAARLYASDSSAGKTPEQVRDEVLAWCRERGDDPLMRVAVCGYDGDGYESLPGWESVSWEAQGGYGNRSDVGRANRKRERIWFSPHCLHDGPLFAREG